MDTTDHFTPFCAWFCACEWDSYSHLVATFMLPMYSYPCSFNQFTAQYHTHPAESAAGLSGLCMILTLLLSILDTTCSVSQTWLSSRSWRTGLLHMDSLAYNGCLLSWSTIKTAKWRDDSIHYFVFSVLSLWRLCSAYANTVNHIFVP